MCTCTHARVNTVFSVADQGKGEPGVDGFDNPNSVYRLPWYCVFGISKTHPNWCNIIQDGTDHGDWRAWRGLSPTANTGPGSKDVTKYGETI